MGPITCLKPCFGRDQYGSLIVMVPAVFTGQHSGEGMLLLNRIPVLAAQKITS